MRVSPLFAAFLLIPVLGGCAAMVSDASFSGPPEWFLREDEKARLAQARAAAAGPREERFTVLTELDAETYADRLALVAESCWVRGERGWRVARPSATSVRLEMTPEQPEAAGAAALTLAVEKAPAPGLLVLAEGPLAPHRDRIEAALTRAEETDAPCPSPAAEAATTVITAGEEE